VRRLPVTLFGQFWPSAVSVTEHLFHQWLAGSAAMLSMLSFQLIKVLDGHSGAQLRRR
jgi:hypothetical protein